MIAFTCLCGEKLEVPAELAGELIQCPRCLRLTDVPRFHDVNALEDDGTLRLQDDFETPSALDSMFRAFGGRDDMRGSVDEFLVRATDDPTLPTPRATPRYDAITGELLLPVEILNDDAPPPPPQMDPNSAVLGYARTHVADGEATKNVPWWSMPWRLLTGWSLVSIGMIWAVHAFVVAGLTMPGLNVFFALIALVLSAVIAAHYVNTMEDFGPNDKDRVPVLLRSVSLSEDVFYPLLSILMAAVFAFGPMMIALIFTPRALLHAYPSIIYVMLTWGALWFPLALFTVVCGGVWQNMSPGRMWSVLTASPARYAMAAVTFYIACVAYLFALGMIEFKDLLAYATATKQQVGRDMLGMFVVMGIFVVPTYLMHLAAAWFGLIYKRSYEKFDWVLQRHERSSRNDVTAELLKKRVHRASVAPPAPAKGFEIKV